MKAKIKITLQRNPRHGIGEPYTLTKLVNATSIQSAHERTVYHYVGDALSEEQAATLLVNSRYEVTVISKP